MMTGEETNMGEKGFFRLADVKPHVLSKEK